MPLAPADAAEAVQRGAPLPPLLAPLLSAGRGHCSSSSSSVSSVFPPRQQPPDGSAGWAPPQQRQQSRGQQQQQLQQQPASQPGSGDSSSRRRVPTASGRGDLPGSSARPGRRSPLDMALRAAIGGGGLAAGIGGGSCGPSHALQLRLWPLPGWGSRAGPAHGSRPKTVLIMMSNTGGGHKASAEALAQAFAEKYGDAYKVVIVDMWKEHTPPPFSSLPDSYSFLVRHGFLWRFAYESMQPRAVHVPYMAAIHACVSRHLAAAFDTYDPDLVVSVHPLMQHIPSRVLRARARRLGRAAPTPLATVVTDFTTCHNTWFCKDVNACFVPTEFCRQLGLRMGLSPQQLVLYGLPIRPIFSKPLPSKAALRKKLGLLKDKPAILLVGGGEGMGKLQVTVEQLDARLQGSAQVVVICGRNRKLLRQLSTTQWPGGSHVVACGFVDNIHEWMAAVDCIITKAGPGTIAEALISGLPILLNGNVPCQEEGNIPYVLDNGVGTFETDPARIAAIMADWLDPSNRPAFRAMAAASAALGRPRAVYHIVADLKALADGEGAAARLPAPPAALPVGQLVAA